MRLVTYESEGGTRVGIVNEDETVAPTAERDLSEVIRTWSPDRPLRTVGAPVALDSVRLLAPLPRPARNVFCVGKNYRAHVQEFSQSGYDASSSGEQLPERPVVFTKPPTTVVGPGADIERHRDVTDKLDYEAELGVIIGRGGRNITEAEAAKHVWGYTIVNDVTARDRQHGHKQWFLGKGLDTFCPMGPWAVTADEVDPAGEARPDLEITCRVNGELRQKASTLDLIFDIPRLISVISAGLTLQPGDLIATGTPAGVGIGMKPPRFLEVGDEVEISVTGLGILRNTVAESPQATVESPPETDATQKQRHKEGTSD